MRLELSNQDIFIIIGALEECRDTAFMEGEDEAALEYRRLAYRMSMYFDNRKEENENTSIRIKEPRTRREVRKVPKKIAEGWHVVSNISQ